MNLAEMLTRIANSFTYERAKPFKDSAFGNFVRHDVAIEAKKQAFGKHADLKVKASVGAGNWAAVPWLAFFDPLVTETATQGFYVVYLINPQDCSIVLSLNQGTTAVYEEFGRAKGKEVLKRRAVDLADRVRDYTSVFSSEPIDLGSRDDLPVGYQAGHAFGLTYRMNQLTQSKCISDLSAMLNAYQKIVERGGLLPTDLMISEYGGATIDETRRLVMSRRIERSPKVRRAVLSERKPICEGCGLDPVLDYCFKGRPHEVPLDVHHATPLYMLEEGENRRYRIPEDFLVLCPTCHRMIHKQKNASDIEQLRKHIRFKHMREVGW